MVPRERLEAFFALKRALDPAGVLESDLWRRVAPEEFQSRASTA
jgi:FAD/FMN-containing dehydrogenase